jgi:hypothetical protein
LIWTIARELFGRLARHLHREATQGGTIDVLQPAAVNALRLARNLFRIKIGLEHDDVLISDRLPRGTNAAALAFADGGE